MKQVARKQKVNACCCSFCCASLQRAADAAEMLHSIAIHTAISVWCGNTQHDFACFLPAQQEKMSMNNIMSVGPSPLSNNFSFISFASARFCNPSDWTNENKKNSARQGDSHSNASVLHSLAHVVYLTICACNAVQWARST